MAHLGRLTSCPRKGSYRRTPSGLPAPANLYPARPQLRELAVNPARPQQFQAVLRTLSRTAVIVFGILKTVLQEKTSLRRRLLVSAPTITKLDPQDRNVSSALRAN